MSKAPDNASGAELETVGWVILNSLTGRIESELHLHKPSGDDHRWQDLVRRTDASRLIAEKRC